MVPIGSKRMTTMSARGAVAESEQAPKNLSQSVPKGGLGSLPPAKDALRCSRLPGSGGGLQKHRNGHRTGDGGSSRP